MRIYILVACLWLATSPLNAKIVFDTRRDGGLEVYTMNADGTNPTRVTKFPADAGSPAFSPNGRQIALHSDRGSQLVPDRNIWVIDVDGTNPRQLTFHPKGDRYPDWSPDGTQIAFSSDRAEDRNGWPTTEIYVMDADGGNVKRVTDLGFASRPRWSPDGQWILFEGIIDQEPGRHILAIRPDGTDMWMVSEPRPETGMYVGGWSPDGKRVVYAASIRAQVAQTTMIIATLNRSGRLKVKRWEEVPLPKMPVQAVSFGAAGKSILFGGQFFGSWQIFRFQLDTHELIQLTDEFHRDLNPRERNPRLSVSPAGLAPKRWGEIKSGLLQH